MSSLTDASRGQALARLPLHIADSWQRCRGMGLASEFNPQPNAVSRHQVRDLLERDQLLARVAAGELRTLGEAVADTDHLVILADDRGHIVSTIGRPAAHGPVLRHARSGVDCSETRFGTNAAGTALVTGQAVYVNRQEHFFNDLRHMECLAVPIFRPCGALIGVLDVSCETRPLVPGLMELVQGSVARIERLLLRELRSPHILRLHPHPGCIGTPFEALVALGGEGEVLGLNTLGARLLGVSRQQAVGRPIGELLSTDLRRLDRHGAVVSLRTLAGLSLHATLAETPDLEGRHGRAVVNAPAPCAPQHEQAPPEPLTRRELKVLYQLDTGQSNSELAEALFISEGTLKWHLHNIYGKLGARSRAGALARARALGLLG
jgi:transcriptional regulator of acetoin/glycerol metabolism